MARYQFSIGMARYQFSIDRHSDDVECHKGLEQLHRLARLGREAQAAIDAIETSGYFEGAAPVAAEKSDDYYKGQSTETHKVRYAILQKRTDFSRKDLPPLDNLQLEYGPSKAASYGGHDCIEVPLYCIGEVARQVDALGTLEFTDDKHHLGTIRINKHHLSWVEDDYSHKTVQIYRTFSSSPENARKSALAFAKRLARLMVDTKYDGALGVCSAADNMAAKTLDLQNAVPEWFVEDGVVERMFGEIHRYIRVMQVMES